MDSTLDKATMNKGSRRYGRLKHAAALLADDSTPIFQGRDCQRVADALAAAFPASTEAVFAIEPITTGFSLSSQVFFLIIADRRYVLRLVKDVGWSECRDWHVRASQILADQKLGPSLIYASPDGTILINHFVDEHMPKWNARFSSDMAAKLAHKLRLLHATPHTEIRTNQEISASGLPNDSRVRVDAILNNEPDFFLQSYVLETLTALETLLPAQSLVHHDLHIGNVLYDGDEFWLIDLESIGIGDPFLDLAVICHMTVGCSGMEEIFLAHYFQRSLTVTEKGRLYLAKTVSTLRYAISSFSKCEQHADLVGAEILPICKYLDYTHEIDGVIDLASDSGKYWECIALVKLALDYLAAPEFQQAMHRVTGDDVFWAGGLYRPPKAMDKADGLEELTDAMLLALARLLRTLSQEHDALEQVRHRGHSGAIALFEARKAMLRSGGEQQGDEIVVTYERLHAALAPHARLVSCHFALRAARLTHTAKDGQHRFWLADRTDCAPGYALFDLATIAIDLNLSKRQEQFLLICHNGSRISERDQAYYFLVKQLARLRMAIDDLSIVKVDQNHRAYRLAMCALQALSSPHYGDALSCLRT